MLLYGVLTALTTCRDFGEFFDVRPHRECSPARAIKDEAANLHLRGYLLDALEKLCLDLMREWVERWPVHCDRGDPALCGPTDELARCFWAHVVISSGESRC
jgi:hypothetical protein